LVSDEALYERLLAADLSAFDDLYERHARRLLGFIRTHLSDAAEAEDVLHDAFLAVLREGRAGRAARTFKPWLYQVSRNLCLNRLRSRSRGEVAVAAAGPSHPEGHDLAHPEQALVAREALAALRAAASRLPREMAELYRLRAAGLSYEELSGVLEVPLGTVKSRLHEMVRRLREEVLR
jgi:RNA polymerase sigma-70 factor (ECF subfamily)